LKSRLAALARVAVSKRLGGIDTIAGHDYDCSPNEAKGDA
jgi:hypothetical protein